MADADSIKQRLVTVLDYDDIPKQKRAAHLAAITGLSLSTARRMLNDDPACNRRLLRYLFQLAEGLRVNWCWLYQGKLNQFDPRSARIQLVMIDGEKACEADAIIKSISSPIPGKPEYASFGNDGHDLSTIILVEQHRRLDDRSKPKNMRFMMMLINGSPKASRWLEMYSRGQISRQQIFGMI